MANEEKYFAAYCRLESESGGTHITLEGNALVIGEELDLIDQLHVTQRGKEISRIMLRDERQATGFLPDGLYKKVAKLLDAGWVCRAFVSAVAYDKSCEAYWSEAAVICYTKDDESIFAPFVTAIAKRIAQGEHPAMALSADELSRVIESKGSWADTAPCALPKLGKDSAYFKTKRTLPENLAYAAAEGNKGCYVGTAAVALVIVFAIVWFLFLR